MRRDAQVLDLFRILKKPLCVTLPSLSPLLPPAIISLSSSSVMSSPSSVATAFKSSNEIWPSPSVSNRAKAFSNPYGVSLSLILVIMISKNSWKSILPDPSLSKSPINFLISSLLGSNPRALKATLSSFDSIVPDPLVSTRSKAYLISFFWLSLNSLFGFFFFFSSFFSPSFSAIVFDFNLKIILKQINFHEFE